MAEKKKINIGIYDELHRKNLLKRAKQVQMLYKQAVQKIIQKAQPTLFDIDPSLDEFHFSDFPQLAKAVNGYILQMGQGLQSNVEDGDIEAWTLANTKNDAVVSHMTAAYKIPRETLNKWKHPHLEALAEFMARKTVGMNLSDGGSREDTIAGVWNLKQFKEELELALETGIGQGKSAAELARDVKQYLKNPDKLFRRVRERVITDENGNKRRVGALRLSKAAAAYHPGKGVYRSSYKNALRLTATENNIAYRTADHQRWNALNFVLGQEIKLSNNHTLNGKPFVDICDDLAGKYPKTFKFTGWHPWCRCYATSILADRAEFEEYCKLLEQGKDVSNFKFTGMIGPEDAPEEFRQWVQDNKQRISKAKNMPYFLRDNPRLLESAGYKIPKEQHSMFDWSQTNPKKPQTLLEKAAQRHAARTQEQIDEIKKRAAERQERLKLQQNFIDNTFKEATAMPEVGTKSLVAAINKQELNRAMDVAKSLQQEVAAMKDAENKLKDLIPDAPQQHKNFTIKELQSAHAAIKKTFDRWTWDFTTDNSLQFLKGRLEREIGIVASTSHKTKDIAKAAFERRLELVNKRIDMKAIGDGLQHEFSFVKTTRSANVKNVAKEIEALLKDNNADLAMLRDKADDLRDKVRKLEARRKTNRKTNSKAPNVQSNAEIKKDVLDAFRKRGEKITEGDIIIEDGAVCLTKDQHRIIAEKFMQVTDHEKDIIYGRRKGYYVGTGKSFQINGALRDVGGAGKNVILGDIDKSPNTFKGKDMFGHILTKSEVNAVKVIDRVIVRNKTEFPIKLVRNLDFNGINPFFGGKLQEGIGRISDQINNLLDKSMKADPAFMSASTNAEKNLFKSRKYQLQIEIPKGTPLFLTDHYLESEAILGRMTNIVFKSVETKTVSTNIEITVIKCSVKN
jgi:hypothetical protein